MKVEYLTQKNFNNREFKITYYGLQDNPQLLQKKRPLILVFPGGSFDHLSLREGEPVALAYAAHGFNAAVVSYNLTTDPGKIYPDAALSGLKAVSYFRENSEKLGINQERITTIGFSAGGHVVSSMNVMAESEKCQAKYDFNHDQVAPNATILGYPLINIKDIGFPLPADANQKMPTAKELLDTALGVTPDTPPTFIFQAVDDPVVLIDNTIEYITALRKKKVHFEAHLFNKGGHGFSLATPEVAVGGREPDSHLAHWFKLSLEWLKDRKIYI